MAQHKAYKINVNLYDRNISPWAALSGLGMAVSCLDTKHIDTYYETQKVTLGGIRYVFEYNAQGNMVVKIDSVKGRKNASDKRRQG